MIDDKIYPDSVEDRIEVLCSAAKLLKLEYTPTKQDIRDAFGDVLFQQWLDGNDENFFPFDNDEFLVLIRRASAKRMLADYEEQGLLDCIVCNDNGEEMVFITDLGKQILFSKDNESSTKKNITTLASLCKTNK